MPDVPIASADVYGQIEDAMRRLRAVERDLLDDDALELLQTFENGQPLGDTRFLDFGVGLKAVLTGDGFVRVTAGTGGGECDAIVDGNVSTNVNASPPIFGDGALAISACLEYLANDLGLTSCIVGVRPWNNPGASLGYAETADWTMPLQTRLFGLRGAAPPTSSINPDGFAWDLSSFKGRTPLGAIPNLRIENCIEFESEQSATDLRFGTVWAYDCYIERNNLSVGYFCGTFYGVGCTFDFVLTEPRLASARAQLLFCDVGRIGAGLFAGTSLEMIGSVWGGGTITLPVYFYIDSYVNVNFRAPSFPGAPSLTVPLNGNGYIRIPSVAGAQVTASSTFGTLVLEGGFNTLTLTGTHDTLRINADNPSGLWNITGPVDINATAAGAARFQFRGEGVAGTIAADGLTGTTTFLDFVGCDRPSLVIGADPGSGPRKAFAFDATSDRGALFFPGHDNGWTPGTDAGTDNVVGPPWTGSAALLVGVEDEGVPQGSAAVFDFVGPGVTATEAGGVATITIPGGTTIDGHVIEDEGTPLTQRANLNFVGGGVTATDAAPDTVVTIPGPNIAETFMAAKGDLITATANDTPVIKTVGADGTVLTADSTQADGLRWATPSGYKLVSFQYIAQGTTTYTTPAGIDAILVECIGAGGGGGGVGTAAAQTAVGAGGGGGGYARKFITSPAGSYTVAVGAGGGGGAGGGATGTTGGTTTFDSPSVCTATGGAGGSFLGPSATANAFPGGAGGTGTVGDLLLPGEPGSLCVLLSAASGCSGNGGMAAMGGGGARGAGATAAGTAATGFGGGGAGALSENNGGNQAGGSGANGRIIVWEYASA